MGLGKKTWGSLDVLTAADLNGYLMDQAVIKCTSATRPASPDEGMTVYETDTDRYSTYTGSAWVTLGQTITGTYTPTLTATSVNPTLGSGGSAQGRYTLFNGNWCTIRGTILFGTSGAASGTGQYLVALPLSHVAHSGITAGLPLIGSAIIYDASSTTFTPGVSYLGAGSNTFSILVAAGKVSQGAPWVWTNNDYISFELTYEFA